MAKVSYENVTKKFGNFTAVHDFNLEVKDHEFLCLVGPSGCGKTTTLRMLAGLDDVTEGLIKIDGEVINDVPPKEREIAMVFQSYALYPHYNVYENLAFSLRAKSTKSGKRILQLLLLVFYIGLLAALYGISALINLFVPQLGDTIFIAGLVSIFASVLLFKDVRNSIKNMIISIFESRSHLLKEYVENEREIKEKVQDTAKLLEIDQQLNKKPRQLSGGQRQRVALGRAIIRNPKVFLLDEPLSNLDAKLRVQMRAELQRLSKRLGVTSIYVTHDQIEAMTLGHRIAVIDKGILQQVGEPEEVYLRPKNKFVAGFIGSPTMNFVDGKIIENNGSLIFTSDTLNYEVPERYNTLREFINREVILGIRPEHIHIGSDNSDNNSLLVTIGVSEPIGSDTYIYIDFPNGFIMIVKLEGLHRFNVDDQLRVTFDENEIHFFEMNSELRIKPEIK
jgi:multiple sugar transport system ATP-binding protein